MSERFDNQSPPPQLQEIAKMFRRYGWISFWAQIVLGVVAIGILGFASLSPQGRDGGASLGVFFAVVGVLTLLGSVFWAFRYTQTAKQLESSNPNNRPRKADTLILLRTGLWINLAGLLISLVAGQAIAGALLTKSFTLPQAGFAIGTNVNPNQFIRTLDILVVQANTNTLAAHFVGLAASIWLLNRVTR